MSDLPTTWLTDYDVYHLGLSGGKDSTALMLWAVYESGIDPAKLVVSFNDTGNEDLLTYAWILYLSQNVHPVTVVQPPLDFWQLAKKKGRFPAVMSRFCTEQLKIHPALRTVWQLNEKGSVLIMSGVRRQEGTATNDRGDLPAFGRSDDFGADKYLPIYEWTLEQVWDIHRRYIPLETAVNLVKNDPKMCPAKKIKLIGRIRKTGIPRNPLYDMGARRVGCFPCFNSSKPEIRAMNEFRPERIDFIEERENETGRERNDGFSSFFSYDKVPVDHRSRETVSVEGKLFLVATIRDIVSWSKTKRGGKQFELDLDFDEPVRACGVHGMCE